MAKKPKPHSTVKTKMIHRNPSESRDDYAWVVVNAMRYYTDNFAFARIERSGDTTVIKFAKPKNYSATRHYELTP